MKSLHYQRIEMFMRLAGQECKSVPELPSEEIRRLRANLILEEAIETINALGFNLDFAGINKVVLSAELAPDLREIADGCADLSVVLQGTLIACGIPDNPLFNLVDQNNLDKFGSGHSIRADGKVLKPQNHKPPDIQGLLERLKNECS